MGASGVGGGAGDAVGGLSAPPHAAHMKIAVVQSIKEGRAGESQARRRSLDRAIETSPRAMEKSWVGYGTLRAKSRREPMSVAKPNPSLKPRKPRIIEKPWGRETILAETECYAGKILFVARGNRLSLQHHEHKSETMYLLHGRIRLSVGHSQDDLHEIELGQGELIDLPVGTVHRVQALEDSQIIEASSPELDDIVRLADDFGREGTSDP